MGREAQADEFLLYRAVETMNDGLYNGAGFDLSRAELGGSMQAQQVSAFANGYIERAGAAAGLAVAGFSQGLGGALEYKQLAEARAGREEVQRVHERKLADGLAAAPGSSQSFLLADGSADLDKLQAWRDSYLEGVQEVRPPIMDRENEREWDEFVTNAQSRAEGMVMGHVAKGVRRVADAALRAHAEAGDTRGYCAEVDRQVAAGILTETEGGIMKSRQERRRLRELSRSAGYGFPASVSVGGTEYSGLSAALAMENARGGRAEFPAQDMTQSEVPEKGGDARTLTLMPEGEFGEVSDAFAYDLRVLTLPGGDGGVALSCAATAPECVQRVAAHGNAHGGVDADQARMMVARISLDMVADNPGVTDAQVTAVFDRAGVYEALGDGDAEVGKERARAIAAECLERGRGDSKKLGMGAIEPMVRAHLASREFMESREWGRVAGLDPRLNKGEEWDKSDLDEAGRKRWFGLYDVYRKYRQEFKPDAKGELDKDEFEENAQAFHAWYMKEKYGELKRADEAAAADWYMMRIATDLRQKVYADAEGNAGYAGYGHDVQVAREVLRSMPPEQLGADELVAASVACQQQDAVRSEAFRKAAVADYEKLRGLKRSDAENSEAVKREQERRAKEEERKAERAAREAEKKAERDAARKLFVARSAPREAVWVWDGRNAGDGAMPQCLVPEGEYKRLQEELGYDGSQLVYVQVNGARVLVTGVSRSGKLELNAPAVAKVQKKPNTKKGERWKTSGNLGFSYYFKSTEAK